MFIHAGLPANDFSKREACTSTGIMLSQIQSSSPQESITERYPKKVVNAEKKARGRVYPFSTHDNRTALKDAINVFDYGLGRKKCLDKRRQHSHNCMWQHQSRPGVEETRGDFSIYKTDFHESQGAEGATNRRFPRNHLERSTVAAAAQAGEHFMWFSRLDSDQSEPLSVLAATNCSSKTPQKS